MMKCCWLVALLAALSLRAQSGPWDADLSDFSRQAGETGDSARIRRAFAAAGEGGVVWFPRGEYEIDETLVVSNRCSLLLHKSAHLKAVRNLPFILEYYGRELERNGNVGGFADHNLFIRGGDFDGRGLASCVHVMGVRHFTLADTTYRNGRQVGLQLGTPGLPRTVEGGYEIVANNLYFICNLPGLAGNVGLLTNIGDSHFTDLVVVDHTVGIRDLKWSNRFTRCHVWGGIVKKAGTQNPEYLPNSIAFDLRGGDSFLDDCYADTAMIGYNVCGDSRIVSCGYYNNWLFKMDNPTIFFHRKGLLSVTGGRFTKNSPHGVLYRRGERPERLVWRDNQPLDFTKDEMAELHATLLKQAQRDDFDDPLCFETALERGLKSPDAWVRRYALNELWMKDPVRAKTVGKTMSEDSSRLVRDYLLAIGAIEKKDDFSFYRENIAISQDPSEDHDFALVKRFDLPVSGWRFAFDRDVAGHRGKTPYFAPDFDDSAWKTISVNAQWELQGYPEYDGVAWYRLTFDLPQKPEGTEIAELCVGAVDEDAWIWLNGTYLGQHVEGLAGWDKSFRFNAARELKWGAKNQVTIRVFDSCNAGGIWRPVSVEVLK